MNPWRDLFPTGDLVPLPQPPVALTLATSHRPTPHARFPKPIELLGGREVVFGDPDLVRPSDAAVYRSAHPAIEVATSTSAIRSHDVGTMRATLRSLEGVPTTLRWIRYQFEYPLDDHRWSIQTQTGGGKSGTYPPSPYTPRRTTLLEQDHLLIDSDDSAASSNQFMPFMTAWSAAAGEPGLWFGLEWSGSWYLSATHQPQRGTIRFEAGVKVDELVLSPGEELALPVLHIGRFSGGAAGGTNALRRYLFEHHAPDYMGERPYPRVTYDSWFGFRDGATADLLMPQIDRAAEIGVETWCLDAVWLGDYPANVGNWDQVDARRFPAGIEPLAERARAQGMGFGLWFGPERAMPGSWALREYPEFFWEDPYGGPEHHLDLTRTDAQDWLIDLIGGWIRRLDLKWSRWDHNLPPGGYWHAADPTGKIQFAYMAGLYRVFDELRRLHPQWMIENCASGGRRIDLGTLGRTHTNWLSDSTINPLVCRWMQLRSQLLLPASAPNSSVAIAQGAGDPPDFDEAILSRFVGKLAFDGDIASLSPSGVLRARHWTDHYKRLRHILVGDFRQVSPIPGRLDEPDIVQFTSHDGSESLVAAFLPEPGPTGVGIDLDGWAWEDLTGTVPGGAMTRPELPATGTAGLWHGRREPAL